MFIFLSKALPPLVYPLGLTCLLIASALFLQRRPRGQRAVLLAALGLLWLCSTPWAAVPVVRSLEFRYLPPAEIPTADVIVLLGGGTEPPQYPRPLTGLDSAGDRVVYAAYLYQQGKASHILLSSGYVTLLNDVATSPGTDTAQLLQIMGVPAEALWMEETSQNTYENAVESRKLLAQHGITRVILVTSAMHMPRAVALFEHQGLEVIPAPTDYIYTQADWERTFSFSLKNQFFNLLPGPGNLSNLTLALKEYLGIFIYMLQGWL